MDQRYLMAADCPVCGEKDEKDQWLGARMLASDWGHDFPCCSDTCGVELLEQIKTWTPSQVEHLRAEMEDQCEWRLF